MALNKTLFINSLTSLFQEGFPASATAEERDKTAHMAESIANYIEEYITNAKVTVTILPGTVAVGAGAAAAPNPLPITLTGSKASATGGVS